MDSKTMFLGGLVIGVGVLYYAYDSYRKARDVAYNGGHNSGAFSINLTDQKGMPTHFSTALDEPLYPDPPASQDDVVKAGLPPAVGASTDGICGVFNLDEYDQYAVATGQVTLSPSDRRQASENPNIFSTFLAGKKTQAGCFPTM